VRLFCGVPDSTLAGFGHALEDLPADARHVIAANEGNAIAIASGWWLANGTLPLVYFQNSGLGNAINPLISLAHNYVYGIPLLLIIGWRGAPGHEDEPQHMRQGAVTTEIAIQAGVQCIPLPADEHRIVDLIFSTVAASLKDRHTRALLVRPGQLASASAQKTMAPSSRWTRASAIDALLAHVGSRDAVVATTGLIARETLAQQKRRNPEFDNVFPCVGAMGHASQIALGLALANPEQRVWCFDGDGALLMHLGGMATIGRQTPANLVHVVLDNAVHASVGGHPTCAPAAPFAELASCLGYRGCEVIETTYELQTALQRPATGPGATFLHVRIATDDGPPPPRPSLAPVHTGDDFAKSVRAATTRPRQD
jgi:phosphonopyruvate decarboxylase